jgi:iduronate 2-sulfatase
MKSKKIFYVLLSLFLVCNNWIYSQEQKKNVLLIIVDDLKPALGCYGESAIKTPHIDKLANEGVLFERTYCQVPICGASRASIMSGIRPTNRRFLYYNSKVEEDAPDQVTLPQVFKQNNYHTISNGKVFHITEDTESKSWSEPAWLAPLSNKAFLDNSTANYIGGIPDRTRGPWFEGADVDDFQYTDGQIALKTIKDLERMKKDNKNFFIACGFYRPHLPFYAPKKYWDMYNIDSISTADNRYLPNDLPSSLRASVDFTFYHQNNIEFNSDAWHKKARQGYYASVSYIDQLVGYIMSSLSELGLAENTVVMLIGDHGWHLGEHNLWSKHNLLHNAIHSPMLLKIPNGPSNKRISELTEFVDIYPTLTKLANIDLPLEVEETLEGSSLIPLINNSVANWKNAAFCRFENGETIITKEYTYTEYIKQDGRIERMMYNLKNDPEENINLAIDPQYRELMLDLDNRLHGGWKNAFNMDCNIKNEP